MNFTTAIHRLSNQLHQYDIRGMRMLAHHLPRILLPKPAGPVAWPTIYGFSLWIDPAADTGLERSLYYMGSYERGTLDFMEKMLLPGHHFVDVGANIGLMSLFAARLVGPAGKVSAVEPHPNTRAILKQNIALNAFKQIEVLPCALTTSKGVETIYADSTHNRGAASLQAPAYEAQGIEVETDSFDNQFWRQADDGTAPKLPQLVKIDVEGFEKQVLSGGKYAFSDRGAPAIIVESSTFNRQSEASDLTALFEHIKSMNAYRIFKGTKNKAFTSQLIEVSMPIEMPLHDNVYCMLPPHLDQFHLKTRN